ncbi:hypothetical protein [Nocardioides currus]|uniref:histidine kinase n=1 Tax=Nocardioides currus TaxID=2133958 RepID=A0A2R7YW96_9ACTN|nr:hypothetical protein [Nocardioides currus]PUA80648.1 hypothetical protein C7S10_12905 [Nocardioides currus]
MSTRDELVSFARRSAHDLNNTVAALSMAVEIALDMAPEGDEDMTGLLERIHRNAVKLGETVDGLPDRAREWPLEDGDA